jgi:hypothetical protein
VLKCNDSTLLDEAWKRYLLGYLREATPFREVPIRLVLRSRHEIDPDAPAWPVDETEPPDLTELTDLSTLTGGESEEEFGGEDDSEFVDTGSLMILDQSDFEEDPDEPAPNFVDE